MAWKVRPSFRSFVILLDNMNTMQIFISKVWGIDLFKYMATILTQSLLIFLGEVTWDVSNHDEQHEI